MPSAMKIRRARRLARDKGLASVEFALTIVFVMIVVFWAFELIMLLYSYSVMANAAKEGVRYAIVHGANNSSPSGPSVGQRGYAAMHQQQRQRGSRDGRGAKLRRICVSQRFRHDGERVLSGRIESDPQSGAGGRQLSVYYIF